MNPPKREQTIFAEALRLPPEERAAYLAQATDSDSDLRREVESLLLSYGSGEFLEEAVVLELRPTLATVPATERSGDVIGRYKLLQQIGEGGCGVVYLAQQTEPVRRRVALKIIKLGMDTKSVIARFEAERQALALMDHPNIAKVLDAGATETGRPYFVMELVRGTKITEFCDEKRLSTGQRLDLFMQVCHAIQHAHQKGIIHRDIKPSNILVSEDDGVVVPKVIDFGIAKATGGQVLTDKTVFTAFEQFIGTPAYMSPEQALMTNADIDTRSDIYALGVLLYEMLTGKTPFDAQELLSIGLDEMRRTIRETEPPRPSTCLSTLPGKELSTTAQRRGLDAPKLISELRGDLDWVIMKALEKDRGRRYDTANSMAEDIQRHLSNEPVVARPPSRWYEFQKMVRRHKVGFAATAAVIVALACGLAVAGWMFLKERAAVREQVKLRLEADEQAAIAKAVNEFLQDDMLRQAYGGIQAARGFKPNPDLTVREALNRASERIGGRFKDQPIQEAVVRHSIGWTFVLLGEAEKAIPQLERAMELAHASFGSDHANTLKLQSALGMAYSDAGQHDRALPLLEKTYELAKTKLGPDAPDTFHVMIMLADAYDQAGKSKLAVPLGEQALKIIKANPEFDRQNLLLAMVNLGGSYHAVGKLVEARSLFEESLDLMKTALPADDPLRFTAMYNLGVVYKSMGEFDLAMPLFQKTLENQRDILSSAHPDTLLTMSGLADAYLNTGKPKLAVALLEERLKHLETKPGPEHPETRKAWNDLQATCFNVGMFDQGLSLRMKKLQGLETSLGKAHRGTLKERHDLGVFFEKTDQLDKALAWFQETLRLMEVHLGPNDTDTVHNSLHLAKIYSAMSASRWKTGATEDRRKAAAFLQELETQRSDNPDLLAIFYGEVMKSAAESGALNEAISFREKMLALERLDHWGLNNAAWILATFPMAELRDGSIAVAFAEKAVAATSRTNVDCLDTLAAAYAETGRFPDAVRTQERLLALLGDGASKGFVDRLALFQSGMPYRESPDAGFLQESAEMFYRQGAYAEAEPLYRKLIQSRLADHKDVVSQTASLARVLGDWAWAEHESASEAANSNSAVIARAREAERLLREVLEARLRENSDSWRIADSKSRLGAAILSVAVTDPALDARERQGRLNEAETLMLEGHERLQLLAERFKYRRDAIQRLVRLYEAWNQPGKRAEWQRALKDLDQSRQPPSTSQLRETVETVAETK